MAMVKTTRTAPSRKAKASRQAASPGTQWAEVMAASRPPGGQHREGRAEVAQIGVVADAVDPGGCRERRVHEHDAGTQAGQEVGDGFGVVAGDARIGKERGEQPGAGIGDLVEMEMAGRAVAERALRHDGQHPGAGGGLQHGIARADGGGPERGIGERERRRELLEADLLLGALGVRGLERGDRRQHREHPAGAVRAGAGLAAHGAAVALEEQHGGGLGGLVGVLPDPGAFGVARPEGAGHGGAQRRGVEGPAGFEHGEQGPGRGDERARAGAGLRGAGKGGGTGGKLRARGRVRRRMGVEHGVLQVDVRGTAGRAARVGAPAPPRRACPGPAAPPRGGAGRGCAGSGGGGAQAPGGTGAAGVDQAGVVDGIDDAADVEEKCELQCDEPDGGVVGLPAALGDDLAAGVVQGQEMPLGLQAPTRR